MSSGIADQCPHPARLQLAQLQSSRPTINGGSFDQAKAPQKQPELAFLISQRRLVTDSKSDKLTHVAQRPTFEFSLRQDQRIDWDADSMLDFEQHRPEFAGRFKQPILGNGDYQEHINIVMALTAEE